MSLNTGDNDFLLLFLCLLYHQMDPSGHICVCHLATLFLAQKLAIVTNWSECCWLWWRWWWWCSVMMCQYRMVSHCLFFGWTSPFLSNINNLFIDITNIVNVFSLHHGSLPVLFYLCLWLTLVHCLTIASLFFISI